jgi:hypothetical protein
MKTNEEWLRALKANGAEQENALKDLRERLVHGMRAYLAEIAAIAQPEDQSRPDKLLKTVLKRRF